MKKKILVTLLVAIIVCVMIPVVAHADTHSVMDGEGFDLSTTSSGDIVQVAPGATVTLAGTAPENVRVECGSGVNLTIDDVLLDYSNMNYYCPLKFTGGDNVLTLEGVSNIKGGKEASAINVPQAVKLTINGAGKLNVTAKGYGAGIGSAFNQETGTIIIDSGTVEVNSSGGAGIGSGVNCGYEEITINGGTIRVTSAYGACIGAGMTSVVVGTIYINGGDIEVNNTSDGAGIGGGCNSNREGTIVISGGTIRANASSGAGIGSGTSHKTWDVTISGGTIYANSIDGAGVGGGNWVDAGNIQISGGEVYASSNNAHDIGAGLGKTGGILGVSGDAHVFLEHGQANSLIAATTHNYFDLADSTKVLPRYSVPDEWNYPIGAYLDGILVNISQETTTLGYSESCTLTATTDPSGQAVTWSTTDATIADVNPTTGEVTAGTKEGRVIISAHSVKLGYDECVVYVVDRSEPLPAPSDPVKTVSVQIKDDTGVPLAGVYVNLFSEPQTVRTDANGMAIFHNVPYNTNDPHTLIVQDALGSEIGRYSLNFINGSAPSATIDGNNINIIFDNTVNNTNIAVTMVEDWIAGIVANVEYTPVTYQRVENPETGYWD